MTTNLRDALGAPDDELLAAPRVYPTEGVVVHVEAGIIHAGPRDRCLQRDCIEAAVAAKEEQDHADGADCPKWLPASPAVPWNLRTPCTLDGGHDGAHEPTDRALYSRAVLMLATGQLAVIDAQTEKDARAAYRALVDAHGLTDRHGAFLAGFAQGWAHAHARKATT